MDIQQLLQTTIERRSSDLHLVCGTYPTIRVDGVLYQLNTLPTLTPELMSEQLLSILSSELKDNLMANKEIDFGYDFHGSRFRVNIYHAKGALAASFRLIPSKIKTIEELGLPKSFDTLADYNQGLVLVTGPTGEGKSTTLSSIINRINLNQSRHILTVEDPIEFIYPSGQSLVSQRELHQDTHSWNVALKSALREDPDVVLVGEIRDYETAALVLTIAETGHLVFSTLHTNSTTETINRLINMFPSNEQNQIRAQLSSTLKAVVAQRLLPRADAPGRVAAVELLYNLPSVAAIIREGKYYMIDNVLQTSESEGLIYFERYLAQLYKAGYITREVALSYALRPKDLEKYIA